MKPSKQTIDAAVVYFKARAFADTIRPIVEGYQKQVLEKHQFPAFHKFRDTMNDVVLDPKYSYLLSNEDFAVYQKECRVHQAENKLVTEDPEHCPLLVAQHLQKDAEAEFVKNLINDLPDLGLEYDMLVLRPHYWKQFLEVGLRFVAPFIELDKELELMKGFVNA